MRIGRHFLTSMLLAAAHTVAAQSAGAQNVEVSGAWDNAGKAPRPTAIDVAVPRSAGSMNLFKLQTSPDDFAHHALYQSADGMVVGSFYIYRPAIADASYAMLMTTTAINQVFTGAVAEPEQLVTVAGVRAFHRRTFPRATRKDGSRITTIVGTMRVGEWIVKLRATGPEARSGEVNDAFGAMMSGLRLGNGLEPAASVIDSISQCPQSARLPDPVAATGAEPGPLKLLFAKAETAVPVTSPRKLCMMATEWASGMVSVVLSEEGLGRPTVMLMNDSGDGVMVVPALPGVHGWVLITAIGDKAYMLGPYDRAPGAAQMLSLPTMPDDGWAGVPIASAANTAQGEVEF